MDGSQWPAQISGVGGRPTIHFGFLFSRGCPPQEINSGDKNRRSAVQNYPVYSLYTLIVHNYPYELI
jgi:hypothetical protein